MPSTQDLPSDDTVLHRISIVIPVYRGEITLPALIQEFVPMLNEQVTPDGNRFVIGEVLLVHDCGPDRSDRTLEMLDTQYAFIRPVWLSRNFGQHAATLAGMASATGNWVVTMDEDGQQNPADIGLMLDSALMSSAQLVYARPINRPPHSWLRNALSRITKYLTTKLLGNKQIGQFNSFRLVDGEIARTLAAYCGSGIYLDMGLFWIVSRIGHCPLRLRDEMDRPSGYSYLKLLEHFWRLLFTSGTRPLRLITLLGFVCVVLAVVIAGYALYEKLVGDVPVQGWASLSIVVAFFSGCILTALGVIAEYLAVTMGIVMGKPLYVVVTKPTRSIASQ
ncbi:MAG TPA: glycosyltransferase [Candidatus Competibacter sp.]|nr:glycosyltransferase [Candidatus Competibacter sp.]